MAINNLAKVKLHPGPNLSKLPDVCCELLVPNYLMVNFLRNFHFEKKTFAQVLNHIQGCVNLRLLVQYFHGNIEQASAKFFCKKLNGL